MAIQIISDSACDLTDEYAKEHNVHIVPFYVTIDDKDTFKEREELSVRAFYEKMLVDKAFPKTSLPSIQDYIDAFTKYAEKGMDIICLTITKKFSGSFNSANNAAAIVAEDYPNVKIRVIDSTIITVLQGLLVKQVVEMRDKGMSLDEICANIEKVKPTGRIFFTISGIEYLVHGGRIGKVMSSATSFIKVNPIITFKEGEIFPSGIARNRKSSKTKVLDCLKKHFSNVNDDISNYMVATGFGYDREEGEEFTKELIGRIKSDLGSNFDNVHLEQIGATIAVHTGPHAIGFGMIRRYDAP